MNNKDIKVLEKVYENVDDHDWSVISPVDEYYSEIDYPMDAKKSGNVYYSEVKKGLIIITGTYQIRFYYEEDNFTWEKKYFSSIISDINSNPSNIAFITNEDYENMIAKKDLFNLSKNIEKKFGIERPNIIVALYDFVNRKVSGVDDLYSDFLNDDE